MPDSADPVSTDPADPVVHLVFVEPRIPQNTGNAIRLAAVTGAHLHLVEPLGFSLDEARVRRAGLDYHDLARVTVHADLVQLWEVLGASRLRSTGGVGVRSTGGVGVGSAGGVGVGSAGGVGVGSAGGPAVYAFSAHAERWYTEPAYTRGDVLIFGPEPTGLDARVLDDRHLTDQLRIPMVPGRRSLNLANSAAIAIYEACRQLGHPGQC